VNLSNFPTAKVSLHTVYNFKNFYIYVALFCLLASQPVSQPASQPANLPACRKTQCTSAIAPDFSHKKGYRI